MSIKIGILGYGNLGRGVECAVKQNDDMELVAVFTRRNPEDVKILTETATVCNVADVEDWKDKIDVMIICGGSATDLPKQTPVYAKMFNVIDSFDTHARIPEHFANVDAAAKEGGHVGIISVGWDPGMFSLNRLYANAILPDGKDYTFWGKGVSQGHSDAIRRVEGVKDGKQYTIPVEAALEAVRNGENPELTTRQKHTRECFVVLEEGADSAKVEEEIKTMPNYFSDYDTTVHFITEEEMKRDHSGLPHGGMVIRTGVTGTLSAIVAALIDADLLLLLSDIDGLFTDDPNSNPNAELIHVVEKLDDHLLKMGKSTSTSDVGTGGMASKLTAAKLASAAGTDMVIANGEDFRNIHRVIEGQDCGTLFLSHKKDEFYLMDYLEKML